MENVHNFLKYAVNAKKVRSNVASCDLQSPPLNFGSVIRLITLPFQPTLFHRHNPAPGNVL